MMPNSKQSAASMAATAATDAVAGQNAAVAAREAILQRHAATAAAQRAEFAHIAGMPPNRRTVAQNNRLALFMASAPRTQHAGPTALHALSTAVQLLEVPRGGTIYRINEPSDGFYIVVDGKVVLYDLRDKEEEEDGDDGAVERLGRGDSFGEEDLLSGSRRAQRAEAGRDCASALLLRVPPELYRKHLQNLHQPDFEDKVRGGESGKGRAWGEALNGPGASNRPATPPSGVCTGVLRKLAASRNVPVCTPRPPACQC
ncbi:hypothetical protein Agub_g10912 [Astrephomene gubernaculifera]|uniref:Cyclic nucleotide-binding domain-containing protein n=1 Tax=Astrephomene gubernaculifera TaxID=47775 RepID=A0AAD3HQE5_9CHLO|nr:hypothetical protein Agub_g10912 [Astrephomene gubernaculifera]